MKYCLIIILFSIITGCQPQTPIAKTEAKALLDKWNQAYYEKDTIALNQVLHSGYIYTGADGIQAAKPEVISELATSNYRIFKTDFYDLNIQTYENTAVLRGWESLWLLSANGDTSNVELRFIDIYIKQNGKVQAIATQTFPKD